MAVDAMLRRCDPPRSNPVRFLDWAEEFVLSGLKVADKRVSGCHSLAIVLEYHYGTGERPVNFR